MLKPISFRPASAPPMKWSSASASFPGGLPLSFGVILTVVSAVRLVCIVLLLLWNRDWFLRGLRDQHEFHGGQKRCRRRRAGRTLRGACQVPWHGGDTSPRTLRRSAGAIGDVSGADIKTNGRLLTSDIPLVRKATSRSPYNTSAPRGSRP